MERCIGLRQGAFLSFALYRQHGQIFFAVELEICQRFVDSLAGHVNLDKCFVLAER